MLRTAEAHALVGRLRAAVQAAATGRAADRRVLDEFRRDLEDVQQNEILRRVGPEPVRPVPPLCAVERVEVASVQRRDNRVAEVRKQIAETEGKPAAGL